MTAVLGGDEDAVLARIERARADARQHQRGRPDRRGGDGRAARRLRRGSAGQGQAPPAAGRRRVPHRPHGAGGRRAQGRGRDHDRARPGADRCCRTATARRANRRRLARADLRAGQRAGPMGHVHGDDDEPRRVGVHRAAAGRHADRHRQASHARRRDARHEDPRRPRRGPRAARRARRAFRQPRARVAAAGGTAGRDLPFGSSTARERQVRRAGVQRGGARPGRGARRQPPDHARATRPPSSSGWSKTATRSARASRSSGSNQPCTPPPRKGTD